MAIIRGRNAEDVSGWVFMWKILEVDGEFFNRRTWDSLSGEVRGDEPVMLIMRFGDLAWTVVHLLSPLGYVFRWCSVYPELDEAASDWLIKESKKKDTKTLFDRQLKLIGIRKSSPEVLYMGSFAQRMSGYGKRADWDLSRTGRYFSVTIPQSWEKFVVKYFSEQLDVMKNTSFFFFPEEEVLYDPFVNESYSGTSVDLFEDRGINVLSMEQDDHLSLRRAQIKNLEEEMQHVKENGCLSRSTPPRFIGSHPIMIRGFSSESRVKISVGNDDGLSGYRVSPSLMSHHEVDQRVFLLRIRLVRMLGDLSFYRSCWYDLRDGRLEGEIEAEAEAYISEMDLRFPVIKDTPIDERAGPSTNG